MTQSTYSFRVTAPEQETFDWLYGRAQKSGNVVSAEVAHTKFEVQWRGAVIPDDLAPAAMTVAVRRTAENESLVSMVIEGERDASLSVIRDFAGPLGSRMAEVKEGNGNPRSLKTHADGMEVRGHTGTIRLRPPYITISRGGFLGRATVGKGEKRILLSGISAVQFKPAGPLVNGYIQFSVSGGNESRSRFGHQTVDAGRDENSVIFHYGQREAFAALRDAVEQAIAAAHSAPTAGTSASPSIPEQIQQLAQLRDSGILSDAEFDTKKGELLARM